MRVDDSPTHVRHWRRRVYEVMEIGRGEDRASRIVDGAIVVLILSNIAAFCAETVPHLEERYAAWFHAFELVSVIVFTLEYALRLWACVEMPFLRRLPAWRARLRFARRPLQAIDLIAILPFYLGSLLGMDLRVLRALRLFRFFKLSRYSPAVHTLMRVIQNESRALTGAGLLLLGVLLFSSTGMYFIEGNVQPDKFGSVPLASYWAMTTLTTVGYGDVAPVTGLGKFWAMLTMLCGLCVLALPVAIISTGFSQEVTRRDFVITWSLMARIPILEELEASEAAELMPLFHAHNLPPGIEVLPAGEPGAAMYFISAGRVRLVAGGGHHSELRSGDIFGAAPMIDHDMPPGRYVTASRCRMLKLYREDFHRLEAASPKLGARIREVAARERDDQRRREAAAAEAFGPV